jgi:hypothetical protein
MYGTTVGTSVVNLDPHQIEKKDLDPDTDPHQSYKLDPDPHQFKYDKPKCMEPI